MRYLVLATDYDGTIAHHGRVDGATAGALEELRSSGRKLILVTGRELDQVLELFPRIDLFEWVVAENGALLYQPATHQEKVLAEPPPSKFVDALTRAGVAPLSVGRVVVATWESQETKVLDTIRALGLELQVIFNKGAVMILPSGVNKATGLAAALDEIGISRHNTVGVGDAENDHAFLGICEFSAAVANALPALKERADMVLSAGHGAGVAELIERIVRTDLEDLDSAVHNRHCILLGRSGDRSVDLPAHGPPVLLAGSSGGGKSTLVTGLLERLAGQEYQYLVIDPEGDYQDSGPGVVLGDPRRKPSVSEILSLLETPRQSAVVNLLGIALDHRPEFFGELLPAVQQLRVRTGRPHWIVVDEAHHLLPASWNTSALPFPRDLFNLLLVTVHPEMVSPSVLELVRSVIAVGEAPGETLAGFARAAGIEPPAAPVPGIARREALLWSGRQEQPLHFRVEPPTEERRRHHRKYAEGELPPERSFYFRGPEGKLNLRARNLFTFLEMADGVDDATWLHHLHGGDYSAWFQEMIKDDELAGLARQVEAEPRTPASESRSRIRSFIEERYTLPA